MINETETLPTAEEIEAVSAAMDRLLETPTIVRAFSSAGPCLTLGRLTKTTASFYCYEEWQGGDRFEGAKKVRRRTPAYYSGAHIDACPSCRDHVKTQYPNGYMD